MQNAHWVQSKDENGQDILTWNGYEIRNAGFLLMRLTRISANPLWSQYH